VEEPFSRSCSLTGKSRMKTPSYARDSWRTGTAKKKANLEGLGWDLVT